MHRSIADPRSVFDLIEKHFFGFLERVGYEQYARAGLLTRLKDHLCWARENNEPLVAFFYFWFLYATIDEVMHAVDAVERRAKPWMSEETLTRIREFAKSRMWDLRTTAFLPQNAKAIATKLRHSMIIAVVCRDGHVLDAPEPDPREVIRLETIELGPKLFREQLEDVRETARRSERIARVVSSMKMELQRHRKRESEEDPSTVPKRPRLPPEAIELEQRTEPWLARIAMI